ncbi:hypothetical protein JOL62DRAFT_23885 [Phyllosticta paracitricarpa]|uniref:Uncharacterized protein n=1 Tax=Phyllosticta paracitricarpa TaxID=2016321 RepID=A0ABR1NCC8_9PEZI
MMMMMMMMMMMERKKKLPTDRPTDRSTNMPNTSSHAIPLRPSFLCFFLSFPLFLSHHHHQHHQHQKSSSSIHPLSQVSQPVSQSIKITNRPTDHLSPHLIPSHPFVSTHWLPPPSSPTNSNRPLIFLFPDVDFGHLIVVIVVVVVRHFHRKPVRHLHDAADGAFDAASSSRGAASRVFVGRGAAPGSATCERIQLLAVVIFRVKVVVTVKHVFVFILIGVEAGPVVRVAGVAGVVLQVRGTRAHVAPTPVVVLGGIRRRVFVVLVVAIVVATVISQTGCCCRRCRCRCPSRTSCPCPHQATSFYFVASARRSKGGDIAETPPVSRIRVGWIRVGGVCLPHDFLKVGRA